MIGTKISKKRIISGDETIGSTSKRSKPTPAFLQKLFHMLEHASADPNDANVVSWSHDGKCFTIRSIQSFTKRVLPKYFESSFTSFKRQLNYYGFQKLNDEQIVLSDDDQSRESSENPQKDSLLSKKIKEKQSISYRHEHGLLQKGRGDLLENIKRATAGVDPKIETKEMKQTISLLEGQVNELQNQVIQMQSQMNVFTDFMSNQMHQKPSIDLHLSQNLNMDINPKSYPRAQKNNFLDSIERCQSDSSAMWNLLRDDLLEVTPKQNGTTQVDEIYLLNEDSDVLLRASSIMSTLSETTCCDGPARIELDMEDVTNCYEAVFQTLSHGL